MLRLRQLGPELSHDARDKLMAALLWWVARDKSDPMYAKAPRYFDAILEWHEALSPDAERACAMVIEIYVRDGGTKRLAKQYAAKLAPVPKFPDILVSWV